MRTLYEMRQQILLEEVERNLKGLLEMKADDAGMHMVGWLPDNFDDRTVAEKAAEAGIKLSPVSDHCINPYPRNGLIFGYAGFDEKQIRSGVAKLAEVLTETARNRNGSMRKKTFAADGDNLRSAVVCS